MVLNIFNRLELKSFVLDLNYHVFVLLKIKKVAKANESEWVDVWIWSINLVNLLGIIKKNFSRAK